MSTVTTPVFMNGNSQAVRIPQEFRLQASRVQISRGRDGELILRPVPADRGSALLQALNAFGDDKLTQDFVDRLARTRREPIPVQEREPF